MGDIAHHRFHEADREPRTAEERYRKTDDIPYRICYRRIGAEHTEHESDGCGDERKDKHHERDRRHTAYPEQRDSFREEERAEHEHPCNRSERNGKTTEHH